MLTFIAKQQEDKSFMPPIRVLVVGDDKDFNQFLQVYVKEYVIKNMNVNKAIDFRIYLVPHRVNTLAHYIAMYDDLYC